MTTRLDAGSEQLAMSVMNPIQVPNRSDYSDVVDDLRRCLGQEFSIFDIHDGHLVHESSEQPNGTAAWRMQLVDNWNSQDEVYLDLSGGPLAVLLLPLSKLGYECAAALGVFRLSNRKAGNDLGLFVQLWQTDLERIKVWLSEREIWTPAALRRVSSFALEKLASDGRVKKLSAEVESLAARIGETFEEISLLYEMSENLRGSSSAAELARLVLDWLVDILPAEQAIIEINTGNESPNGSDNLFQSFGECHLDETSFHHLIEYLQPGTLDTPLVMNEELTGNESWPFPEVRELIVVPLCTDNRNTGWLAALNHAAGGWFGTTQARLLHAAATILGMRVMFEEVAELREASEATSAAKSVFLTNVSHEFRTPLNGIMSFTRLLIDESESENTEQHEFLQTIDSCSSRLLELVEDVVEFAKLEAGNASINRIPFRPDEIVIGVVSELQKRARAKNLRLEMIGTGCSRAIAVSDPRRLQQVLTVLVRNAIKFTEEGVIQVGSRITDDHPRRLQISVRDTGIGIATEKLETIFDPFTQGDGSTTRSYGGLGLGLAISKRLARSLGGDLKAESQLGQGSAFTLEVDAGVWNAAFTDSDELLCASPNFRLDGCPENPVQSAQSS